jgi:hypothetical protein
MEEHRQEWNPGPEQADSVSAGNPRGAPSPQSGRRVAQWLPTRRSGRQGVFENIMCREHDDGAGGDVNPAEAKRMAERYFGPPPASPARCIPRSAAAGAQDNDSDSPTSLAMIAYKRPRYDKDDAVFDMLQFISPAATRDALQGNGGGQADCRRQVGATFPNGRYRICTVFFLWRGRRAHAGRKPEGARCLLARLKSQRWMPDLAAGCDADAGRCWRSTATAVWLGCGLHSASYGDWRKPFTPSAISTGDGRRRSGWPKTTSFSQPTAYTGLPAQTRPQPAVAACNESRNRAATAGSAERPVAGTLRWPASPRAAGRAAPLPFQPNPGQERSPPRRRRPKTSFLRCGPFLAQRGAGSAAQWHAAVPAEDHELPVINGAARIRTGACLTRPPRSGWRPLRCGDARREAPRKDREQLNATENWRRAWKAALTKLRGRFPLH